MEGENLVTISAKRMILVEVDFVEASSGSSKAVGIKPPSAFVSTGDGASATVSIVRPIPGLDSGQTQKSASLTVNAGAATDFSAAARFDQGAVRVLSRPRLVCASGEKAEFLAGVENAPPADVAEVHTHGEREQLAPEETVEPEIAQTEEQAREEQD